MCPVMLVVSVMQDQTTDLGSQCLPASERLRHRREFARVFQNGMKQVSSAFVLYFLPTTDAPSRLGMAVSKRVGGAVVRNRVKRRTREFFRRHKAQFQPPCDVVVVARHKAAKMDYAESAQEFLSLLRRYRRVQEAKRGELVSRPEDLPHPTEYP